PIALASFQNASTEFTMANDVVFATLNVFGRSGRRGSKGGRGHYGNLCSGLILGGQIAGGVVGGLDSNGQAVGLNSKDGSTNNPDVDSADTLNAYYKTLMRLAGVSSERRDVRIPDGKDVAAV
ncbi:MAG: hypothetical protein AAFQ82_24485, partial [Myxococcota bacterium]